MKRKTSRFLMKKSSLKKTIEKVVKEYNQYRSPEATASVNSVDEKFLKIKFTGSFCNTCGYHDYFDDFIVLLDEVGLKSKIGKIKEIDKGAVVRFQIT